MTEANINSTTVQPEKTPLIIGPGIVIKGHVFSESADLDERMLILGRVEGDISTKGIVQVAKDAVVTLDSTITCGQLIVSGTINGEGVSINADLLVLQSTGRIDVSNINLPPGGLEQMRGAVLNITGRLDMSSQPVAQPATAAPVLVETRVRTRVRTAEPADSVFSGMAQMPSFSGVSKVADSSAVDQEIEAADHSADGAYLQH